MSAEGHVITLRLLKGFALSVDHKRVPLSSSAQRLLAFLALQDMPRTRTYVAGTLWPDVTASRANANLRSSLWRATRTGHHIIEASTQELAISKHIDVDLHTAAQRAHRLLDMSCPCDDILSAQTRADLSADLLPEWSENEWVLIEREQYHELRLYALEAMTERLTAMGRHGEAVAAGLAAVRAEPLRESAHRVLMNAHLAAGNRGAAMLQYEQCRRVLLDELGLEPSRTLRSLVSPHPEAGTPNPPARRVGPGPQRATGSSALSHR
ncbi:MULTISPECIES: AfsR/SARP family transcriptional regulator [Streptomyces]|uniref:SARP family transcriptional regulator n=1 Tax=Streptomyces sparsogenes DSM 40356 TaxID=1331668 RepID=A0A1R1SDN6_9ACTN|nr:BTAD domain-containing putative transcriptional regulator [Streptomyces sparsogenes]OMI36474.1 SARP family transcriptional regulator [Streptomyces sparsogenes DSM 40356]